MAMKRYSIFPRSPGLELPIRLFDVISTLYGWGWSLTPLQRCSLCILLPMRLDLVWFYGISTIVGYLMPNPFLYIYMVPSISFQTFLIQAFKIVIDSWKFSMLLLYILWDDWPIFMISGSNEQLEQELEYTLLKPDAHSWWISNQSGRADTLEEWYAIKFCFKLGKNATETYGMLQTAFQPFCMNRASVFEWHKRFKEGRESLRYGEVWEE